MLNVLLWLITVEAVALAVLPLSYYLFPHLRDRGFSISLPLGLLLIGYLSWILSVLRVLPSTQLTILALVVVVGAVSWRYMWPRRRELMDFVVRERTAILVSQAVLVSVFLAWVVYRAYDPAIDHTEQPMDFMFLNATVRSYLGSPEDPWLRGEPVSYYYFGYWMMGVLTKLTGIPSNVSYNLSMALIPAMGAMGIFGLVCNMVRSEASRLRYAVAGGIAGALLLTFAANLEGVLEFMRANGMGSAPFWNWLGIEGMDGAPAALSDSWRPQEFMWWWRATRVIGTFDGGQTLDYTIHEFPFFSFMLGDLHPHVMSLPFVILFLSSCWELLRSPVPIWRPFHLRMYAMVVAMGLSLGGLAFINMWDWPVFWALMLGITALKAYRTHGSSIWHVVKRTAPVGMAVIAVSFVLFLPHFLNFTSQVSGIGPVGPVTTRPVHLFLVWALFLVAVTPFILGVFWQTTVDEGWGRLSAVSLLVGFGPYVVWAFLHLERGGTAAELTGRFLTVLPWAMLISIAVYSALWLARKDESASGRVFALTLSALGLLLIMGPELLSVDDAFGGAWERMNTVFKLYYQGWVLLAAASGFALYYWGSLQERVSGWKTLLTRVWAAGFAVLLVGTAYYPLAAAATKGRLFHDAPTLDGLAYVDEREGGEYGAIRLIRESAGRSSAVLEAVGGDYTAFGRVSASTGVPTVLGWEGHERQWRGAGISVGGALARGTRARNEPAYGEREQDVATIYKTQDVEHAKELLAKYRVDHVYVGARERQKYGQEGLSKFASFMETIFDQDGVAVYRLRW